MISDYYVYMYVDPNDQTPFYVGKGRKGRYLDVSQKQRNKHLYNKIQKLRKVGVNMKDITRFEATSLSNSEALKKEIELISLYGRKDLNNGPLLNYTNGGDGVCGKKPNPILENDKNIVFVMYKNGNTAKEIAKYFNLKSTTPVYYLFKIHNVKRRPPGKRPPNICSTNIIEMYQKRQSINYIAQKVKCDHNYIKTVLQKHGMLIVDARIFGYNRKKGI